MSITYNNELQIQTAAHLQASAEVRSNMLGSADLRAEWMREYAIEGSLEIEPIEELVEVEVKTTKRSSRSLQTATREVVGSWR
jgi:hypothetical protein